MRLLPTRKVSHDGKCSYCERPFGTLVQYKGGTVVLRMEFDHVVPVSTEQRGVYMEGNVVAACHLCNRIKGALVFGSLAAARNYVLDELLRLNVATIIEAEPKPRYERACAHCEKEFVSGQPEAKFCSDRCRVAEWSLQNPRIPTLPTPIKRSNRNPKLYPGKCFGCRKKYLGNWAQRYCSTECRVSTIKSRRLVVEQVAEAKKMKAPEDASDEIKRQYGARLKILGRLQIGPATSRDLAVAGGTFRYGARVADLRKAGHNITSENLGKGLWKYTLVMP
jgi:hypothetical protein